MMLEGVMGEGAYQPAVADGPSDDAPCVTLCPNLEWEDLGGVEPWHG